MKITDQDMIQHQGEDWLPKYMGLSYFDYARAEQHFHLIPFNLLVRWVRDFWYFARYPKHSRPTRDDTIFSVAFRKGYASGRCAHSLEYVEEDMNKVMEIIDHERKSRGESPLFGEHKE